MNLKDKRTRRIAAACASAAVVTAGGVTVGASIAGATGTLSMTTGSAFTTLDLGTAAISASVHTLKATTGLAAGDSFTLSYGGSTTASLAGTATTTQVQTALNNLATITAAGGVSVTQGAGTLLDTTNDTYLITFNVSGARTAITATNTGGNTGAVAVTETTVGGTAGSLPAGLANATFGTNITTSLVGHLSLVLDSYTAPSGVTVTGTPTLLYARQTSGAATGPTGAWTALSAPGTSAAKSANLNTTVGAVDTDDTFVTANKPGIYTFHFTDDANTAGTDNDANSQTVTMTVLDAEGVTAATSDDWAPVVGVPGSVAGFGAPISASVPFSAVTTADTRNSSSGVGVLGSKLAALVGVKFTSTGSLGTDLSAGPDYTVPAAVTAGASAGSRLLPTGVAVHAGTVTSTATFDRNGDATLTDATLGTAGATTVATNGVTAVSFAPTTNTSTISNLGTDLAVTATGVAATSTITLSGAPASNLDGHRLKISKTGQTTEYVVVKSGGTTTTPTLESPLAYVHAAGSTVTDLSAVAVKTGTSAVTYTATVTDADTDKSGNVVYFTLGGTDVASLTTNATLVNAASHIYSVTTDGSGIASITVTDGAATRAAYTVSAVSNNVGGGTFTSTYGDQAASTLSITSTGAQLSPKVSATKVTINGKLTDQFGAAFQPTGAGSLQVTVSKGGSTIGYAALSNGAFAYDYVPATTPTAGSSDTLTFTYGALSATATINWASNTSANAITLTPATTTPAVATFAGGPAAAVTTLTGTVTDGFSAGLAFKTVTLTGTTGVLFAADAAGTNLVNTMDVATNATGSYTVYVVYTRSGAAKITASVDGKTASADVTVAAPGSGENYMVSVDSVSDLPGSAMIVTGKVVDIWGNPVSGVTVDLTPDNVSFGVLGTPSPTNSAGQFSATYQAGSKAGKIFLSAEIWGGVQQVPATTWLTVGGLTLPKSNSVATGNITIAKDFVSLSVSKTTLVGGGNVTVKGNTRHDASVDVYFKVPGEPLQLIDSVTADDNGDFSVPATVKKSGSFLAKTSTATSQSVSVKVVSTAKISARSLGKGWIRVSVSGGPSKSGKVVLYQRLKGGKLKKLATVHTTTGGVSWKIKTGKGSFTFRATYTSEGASTSGVAGVSVKA
jgi:hypothetical protein